MNLAFEALSHGLRTRYLRFAALLFLRNCTATQDSLPAGGQPLPGGIGYPQGHSVKFQPKSTWHSPHPGFAWRKPNPRLDTFIGEKVDPVESSSTCDAAG
jgi:hypothetical protein